MCAVGFGSVQDVLSKNTAARRGDVVPIPELGSSNGLNGRVSLDGKSRAMAC